MNLSRSTMDVSVLGRYHGPMPGVINRVLATISVVGGDLADAQPYPTEDVDGGADFYSTPRQPSDADYIGQHRALTEEDVVIS